MNDNKELKAYIERVGSPDQLKNTGKYISELGKRQQDRKVKELKSHTERSLWFAQTYGLTLESARFSDDTGTNYNLIFSDTAQRKNYKDLPEAAKQRIKEVLPIQDKFCTGEAAYHELTMVPAGEGLPPSYLVKQCKESLNQICHVERTPGETEGAQLQFYDTVRNATQKHVSC